MIIGAEYWDTKNTVQISMILNFLSSLNLIEQTRSVTLKTTDAIAN